MLILRKISDILSSKTSIFIIAVAIITFIFPNLFVWVNQDCSINGVFSLNIQSLILGFIMLTMGMTLSVEDFKVIASRPIDIFIGCIAQFTVMPSIAFLLTHLFNLPTGIAVGLLLVGCCPGGVSSNIMSYLCKGDVAFSVSMTTVNTLLAPIVTPALMLLLTGENVDINAIGMFKQILIVTLFPVIAGFMINYFFYKKESYKNLQAIMPGCSVIGLACIVGGVVSKNGDFFFKSGALIFLTIFLHNSLGYLVGFLIGKLLKFNTAKKRTISIEIGMQNAGLATNLASKHFPTLPEASVISAICCVWHSISGTILANLFILFDKKNNNQNEI